MPPVKRCRWHFLPRQRMSPANVAWEKDAKGNLQPIISVYEKVSLIPKLSMKRTINLSNTQFRYQLVFFIDIYGWLKVAFGIFCLGKTCGGIFCLGKTCCQHFLPRQKMPSASFDWRHVLTFTVSRKLV